MTQPEDLNRKKVLCFGISPGYTRQMFLKRLVESGVNLTILAFPEERFLIDHNFNVIPTSDETLESTLGSLSGKIFDGAVTYSEFRVLTLSESADRLSLLNRPLNKEVAQASRDKGIMKTLFSKAGVPTAEFSLWTEQSQLEKALETLGLNNHDYILKPRLGTTSEGVYRAHAGISVEKAIEEFQSLCQRGAESQLYAPILLPPPFLVEKYIDRFGIPVEIAVEGYSQNGHVQITMVSEKVDMVRSGLFLENKYVSPPKSEFVVNDADQIDEITREAVKALGITDAFFHLEMRYDNNDLKVLEIAARPGGGLISVASKIRSGVDPLLGHLLLSLGMTPPSPVDTGTSTCFGTLFYQEGFDVSKMGQVVQYLAQQGLVETFHEIRSNPEIRKNPIHDWLVTYGVTETSPQQAYDNFYQTKYHITEMFKK